MKRIALFLTLFLFLLAPLTFSQVNLDFTMNLEKEIYYPNEEIKVEINVINRDLQFGAKDAVLSMQIGDRFYDFELGDLKPDAKFTEVITLPRFTPGSKTIRGTLNYTFFGERWSTETYNAFEVAYPPIERYPRNVNVIGFDLPDKLIAGKEYEVKVTVKNEGSVGGDMLVEVASLDEFVDKKIRLEPGQTETIGLTIKFINPEVTLIEARIYALINGEKYLLHYSGKKAYLEEEKKAKLSIDKIAYVGESDKEINQKDEVDIKIYLKNDGNYAAAEVKGTLSSSEDKINITKSTLDYVLIPAGDVFAPENEYFIIKTNDAETGKHTISLEVSYLDSEQRKINFEIPITIKEGGNTCKKDTECDDDSICSNNQCQKLKCECGYGKNHECVRYQCCEDNDCPKYYTCNKRVHICKPPECTKDSQCEDNEVCSRGKCQTAYTLVVVPLAILEEDEGAFRTYTQKELDFFADVSPLGESEPEDRKLRIHYIDPEICGRSSSCGLQGGSCDNEIITCSTKAGLISVADKLVAIINRPIGACGFAPIGGLWSVNKLGCGATPAHELGHQMGLYHIRCTGTEGGACLGPNAADCQDLNFRTDLMSYCSPEDHYGPNAYKYVKGQYFSKYLIGGS